MSAINGEILKLLGIDSHGIRKATIVLEAGKNPEVTLEREVHRLGQAGPQIQSKKYDLVPKYEEPKPADNVAKAFELLTPLDVAQLKSLESWYRSPVLGLDLAGLGMVGVSIGHPQNLTDPAKPR